MDQDYIKELSDEEKEFLNKFNEEYYGAVLDYEDLSKNFHNTKELKKDCTDRNNARNRCMYGIAKAQNKINSSNTFTVQKESINIDLGPDDEQASSSNIEDVIIDYLDSKKTT